MATDIDVLFSPSGGGRLGSRFVDRIDECEAFDRSFAAHSRHVADAGFEPTDLRVPRRNVLVLYGYGGIGKSTLSRLLAARCRGQDVGSEIEWPELPPLPSVPIVVSWKLGQPHSHERLLLELRAALAVADIPCDAFDLAFYRYWVARHPGEDLTDFLRRQPAGAASAVHSRLGSLMRATVEDVLSLQGVPFATVVNVGQQLGRRVRESRSNRSAVGGCPRLAEFLELPDVDDDHLRPAVLPGVGPPPRSARTTGQSTGGLPRWCRGAPRLRRC